MPNRKSIQREYDIAQSWYMSAYFQPVCLLINILLFFVCCKTDMDIKANNSSKQISKTYDPWFDIEGLSAASESFKCSHKWVNLTF